MLTPDEERFESHLKQFRPVMPEPLPTAVAVMKSMHSTLLRAWVAITAGVLVILAMGLRIRSSRHVFPQTRSENAEQLLAQQPLTLLSANTLLATAPSFQAAVDAMAIRLQQNAIPKGKRSAVAALSEEKSKL